MFKTMKVVAAIAVALMLQAGSACAGGVSDEYRPRFGTVKVPLPWDSKSVPTVRIIPPPEKPESPPLEEATPSIPVVAGTSGGAQENDFVKIAPTPESYAWWLRAEFHPFESEVRGIPIRRLRANWCKATEFRKELFPVDVASDFDNSGGLKFSVDGFFDGSKTRQTALIGVYETCDGKRGSFLLVLAWPHEQPSIRFVHEMQDVPFGMIVVNRASTITVFHCMDCDHVTEFRWSSSTKRFIRLRPREVE